jgi:uncharacterized protein (DUF1501 family)
MRTRRWFLRTSGLALGFLGTSNLWLRPAAAQNRASRKVLVAVFQRGAADGLNIVVPFFEKRYYQLRPSIAIQMPGGQSSGGAIDLDGRFAFNQALQPLKAMWDAGQLAVVHAAGSPDTSRSHADAQATMESGTAGAKTADGWLNRALPRVTENARPFAASRWVSRCLRRCGATAAQWPSTTSQRSSSPATSHPPSSGCMSAPLTPG